MIKECPNGCYVTDRDIFRCPTCDQQLKGHGSKSKEDVIKGVEDRQNYHRKDFINSSHVHKK